MDLLDMDLQKSGVWGLDSDITHYNGWNPTTLEESNLHNPIFTSETENIVERSNLQILILKKRKSKKNL